MTAGTVAEVEKFARDSERTARQQYPDVTHSQVANAWAEVAANGYGSTDTSAQCLDAFLDAVERQVTGRAA